jgi:histone deacetylase complex regulatory component SIN3
LWKTAFLSAIHSHLAAQPKQPVEFDQAISYVNKIKQRFVVRSSLLRPGQLLSSQTGVSNAEQ